MRQTNSNKARAVIFSLVPDEGPVHSHIAIVVFRTPENYAEQFTKDGCYFNSGSTSAQRLPSQIRNFEREFCKY